MWRKSSASRQECLHIGRNVCLTEPGLLLMQLDSFEILRRIVQNLLNLLGQSWRNGNALMLEQSIKLAIQ